MGKFFNNSSLCTCVTQSLLTMPETAEPSGRGLAELPGRRPAASLCWRTSLQDLLLVAGCFALSTLLTFPWLSWRQAGWDAVVASLHRVL